MSVIEGTYDLRVNVGAPSAGTSEVQTLTIGGTPDGGTFKIAFDGQTSGSIAWSATNNTLLANINAALNAMPNIGTGGCVATDSTLVAGIGNLLLTFAVNQAKLAVNTMTINTNALTGTDPTLAIAETTAGVTASHRGAGTGALVVNISNGAVYSNTGTALVPVWTLIGTVAGGSITAAELATDAVETAKILNLAVTTAKIDNTAVTAAKLASDAVETAKIKNVNVTEAKLEVGAAGAGISGLVAKFVANVNVIGGFTVLHRIDVADASGDTDITLTHKTRVIDAWAVNTGSAAHATLDTWQVKSTANAISDVVQKTATVNAIKRISTIDPATAEIAAGGKLRITAAKNTNAAVTVYVLGIRVA